MYQDMAGLKTSLRNVPGYGGTENIFKKCTRIWQD